MSDDTPSPAGDDAATEAREPLPAATPRHFVSYAFYKLDPAWRRLDADVREAHKHELTELLESWQERLVLRTYSTVGVRPDADFLVWRATPELELLNEQQSAVLSTAMGAWLDVAYLYTATTKQSQYQRDVRSVGFTRERPLDVVPVDRKYFIVYPFVKQRRWYALPREERGAMMREHAVIGRKYPGIKLNTSYSFGLDDQEFMTAFETDSVHDFLDLMMELRSSEASQYTERDTPIFTCLHMSAREVLDALGGTPAGHALDVAGTLAAAGA
jgi:chlorite dismutase